jgi:transmembrane 9 superfamily protein 2/4
MKKKIFIIINFYLVYCDLIDSYYHKINETLIITTDTIKSISFRIPFDFYYLNLCAPEEKKFVQDNLGEILQSSRKYETNYKMKMFQNEYCKILCQKSFTSKVAERLKFLILKKYKINYFLDSLPAGYSKLYNIYTDKPKREVNYISGIPFGIKSEDDYILYNHYRIYIYYHNTSDNEKAQIVGFEIEPFSIEQQNNTNCLNEENSFFLNSIDLLQKPSQFLSSEKDDNIYFTYDIIFKNSNISFASRFDHYFHINTKIHWASIIISIIMILIFTFITVIIFLRAIKKDIEIYNVRVSEDDIIDEYGWKNIYNDVFRKPINSELLSSLFGTGIQLFIMIIYVLTFFNLGFFRQESRGSLLTMMIIVFVFMSIIGGYSSSRLYKLLNGRNYIKNLFYVSFLFPGFCFFLLIVINILYKLEGSNISINFYDIMSLLILWLCCSFPLVCIGSFIGFKQKKISLPCKVNPLPMTIEKKQWFFRIKYAMFFTGFPTFATIFVEFIYIMSSIWKNEIYSFIAQFILIGIIMMIIISGEISIIFIFLNLCRGDYNWWWKSFFTGCSPIIYILGYSIYYFKTLEITRLSTFIIYFGIISLLSVIIGLICGSISLLSCFIFVKLIYSMIKID